MKVALLERCTHLVVGSGIRAMVRALSFPAGEDVLLVTGDTCLYAEIAHSGDLRPPRGLSKGWEELLFPTQVRDEAGLLHPDRLKLHGEALMKTRGVRLLYACQVLGSWPGHALVAHKSGLYALACKHIYDCRREPPLAQPAYCLHTMAADGLRLRVQPVAADGASARQQYQRYEEALSWLPVGAETLARGGRAPTEAQGLMLEQEAEAGAIQRPGKLFYPQGDAVPVCTQPLDWPMCDAPELSPQEESWDAVVVGGGTSGAVAALYLARQGVRTLLLEMNHQLGGTATAGGVSIYWFGLRSGATQAIDRAVDAAYRRLGLPRRKCLWTEDDVFLPDLKAHTLLGLCLEAGVEVRMGCIAFGVQMDAPRRVSGVWYAQAGSVYLAHSRMLLDCTGDGDLCVFAGAAHTYGSERDGMTYWASLAQYTAPDNYRNNFSTMVHVGDPLDYTRFILAGRQRGEAMYDHGSYVAVRESRHICGMATVDLPEILSMAPVQDALYTCFSNYDPKGRMTADVAYFGMLPPNQRIAIPRGAVIPVDGAGIPLQGLLVGGKAISCTHDAFPGVRMQPDLQRQGLALAALAGCAMAQGCPAWEAKGVTESVLALGGDSEDMPTGGAQTLAEAVASLGEHEPWEWLDAPPDDCHAVPAPVIRIMTAPREEAVPLLTAAYDRAESPGLRLTLARLLLWHGDDRGAGDVLKEIQRMLDETEGLPRRAASVNYRQLLPDHGLMPEVVYLLCSLSHAPHTDVLPVFTEVVERLEHTVRDWRDLRAGIYCYGDCLAYAARKRRDLRMIPLLKRVLALPELNCATADQLLEERYHMLRLTLLGVLYELGDEAGEPGLTAYLQDTRRIFVQAATMLLHSRNA